MDDKSITPSNAIMRGRPFRVRNLPNNQPPSDTSLLARVLVVVLWWKWSLRFRNYFAPTAFAAVEARVRRGRSRLMKDIEVSIIVLHKVHGVFIQCHIHSPSAHQFACEALASTENVNENGGAMTGSTAGSGLNGRTGGPTRTLPHP